VDFGAFDHACMARALRLAERGMNTCRPNPRVGCVITHEDQIVGQGWHERAGEAHAEIMALAEAGERARGGVAYVTLEPCSHQGRTGPCTEALQAAGVQEVVVAAGDPNPAVDGRGLERLRAAGIRVRHGLMEAESRALNPGFFKRMSAHRPWVRVKLAHSLDGGTALANGQSQWISSEAARADVQRWRSRACAILTGIGTLRADNPSLNVRQADVPQPLRVIADSHWQTPQDALTLSLPGDVLIAGRADILPPAVLSGIRAELVSLPSSANRIDLDALLAELARREVNEVHVEAGPTLCGALLMAGLVDEILLYVAPRLLGTDARGMFAIGALEDMADSISLEWLEADRIGPDLRLRLRPLYGDERCSQVS
jgi:diaminohydroxyphosphoribosylaminopyrimidine deaminase/5-amino-6-(5-phosphoribosylamino)uracil reductase